MIYSLVLRDFCLPSLADCKRVLLSSYFCLISLLTKFILLPYCFDFLLRFLFADVITALLHITLSRSLSIWTFNLSIVNYLMFIFAIHVVELVGFIKKLIHFILITRRDVSKRDICLSGFLEEMLSIVCMNQNRLVRQ